VALIDSLAMLGLPPGVCREGVIHPFRNSRQLAGAKAANSAYTGCADCVGGLLL
jgi:hypothetical protein